MLLARPADETVERPPRSKPSLAVPLRIQDGKEGSIRHLLVRGVDQSEQRFPGG